MYSLNTLAANNWKHLNYYCQLYYYELLLLTTHSYSKFVATISGVARKIFLPRRSLYIDLIERAQLIHKYFKSRWYSICRLTIWLDGSSPEPIMLKILLIILSRISQKILLLFFLLFLHLAYYSIIILIQYNYVTGPAKIGHVGTLFLPNFSLFHHS